MYTEASSWDAGDNAKLQLAVPRSKFPSCLTFYYHMYGSSMGTLNVYNKNVKIFTKSGNQGNVWKKVTTTLHPSDVVSEMDILSLHYRQKGLCVRKFCKQCTAFRLKSLDKYNNHVTNTM